ncbi:MAG: precorrin-2 C(20)-methyltransferase [Candidatus Methanomethylophilaceae archaeon]
MKGRLYGIGVGPGDPQLLTLKAKEAIERCDIIAYPVKKTGERSTALEIVRPSVDVSSKEIMELLFVMDPSEDVRQNYRDAAMDNMCRAMDDGKDVAMITLGDPCVYSTFMRICNDVGARGYETEVVSGVPSFCHGAAKAGLPLMLAYESLAIVPASEENMPMVSGALDDFENIVIMKAFASIDAIIAMMNEKGIPLECATVMSNIGMDTEYVGPLVAGREYGYFTTVLVKKEGSRV